MLWDEIRRVENEQRRGGRASYALAGEALGKQIIPPHKREVMDEDQITESLQDAYAQSMQPPQGHGDDYEMVKIPRPRELTFDDVRKR